LGGNEYEKCGTANLKQARDIHSLKKNSGRDNSISTMCALHDKSMTLLEPH